VAVVAAAPCRMQLIARLNGAEEEPVDTVTAGAELAIKVRTVDAYENISPSFCGFATLEAKLKPRMADSLFTAQSEPRLPFTFPLAFTGGEAQVIVPTKEAGELQLGVLSPSDRSLDVQSARARVSVSAAAAVSVEVVNLPEAGCAGVSFELVVHAKDMFGNVDETFESEVALDHDQPPGELNLPNAGIVHLKNGVAKVRVTRKPTASVAVNSSSIKMSAEKVA